MVWHPNLWIKVNVLTFDFSCLKIMPLEYLQPLDVNHSLLLIMFSPTLVDLVCFI